MFVQKYEKESTYANFVNYPNILQKIYFHFFLAGVKQYVYLCGMERRIRLTVEATVLDDDTLKRIKEELEASEDEFNEPGKVKDAKVTFEVL